MNIIDAEMPGSKDFFIWGNTLLLILPSENRCLSYLASGLLVQIP